MPCSRWSTYKPHGQICTENNRIDEESIWWSTDSQCDRTRTTFEGVWLAQRWGDNFNFLTMCGVANINKYLNFRMCFGHLKAPTFTGRCLGIACMHTMVDFSQITFWLSSSVLWIIWDDNHMPRLMISEGKLLILSWCYNSLYLLDWISFLDGRTSTTLTRSKKVVNIQMEPNLKTFRR